MSYNELIDQNDLYAMFVGSKEWNDHVALIEEVSPEAAAAVEKYGIGTKVADSGQYDFESGQLLDDMPNEVRQAIDDAYDAICDLAHSYAEFVRNYDN